MTNELSPELLEQLFAQIERAWSDHRDRTTVYTLAEAHPELRDDLYEFFEDLVLGAGEPSDEVRHKEHAIAEWLRTSGLEMARTAAVAAQATGGTTSSPQPGSEARVVDDGAPTPATSRGITGTAATADNWMAFLRRLTHRPVAELAASLSHVTSEYIVMVSRFPQLVPAGAKQDLVEQIERQWGVPSEESLKHLRSQAPTPKAASRSEPFTKDPTTFEQLLDRSALTAEQKTHWLRYRG
jgi:hypothetical protein